MGRHIASRVHPVLVAVALLVAGPAAAQGPAEARDSFSGESSGTEPAGAKPPRDSLSAEVRPLADDADEPEEIPSFSRNGGYLGLGGAFALENFRDEGDQDDSASIAFRAGYRGYPWLAVELLGEVLTAFDDSSQQGNDVKGFVVTVNAKAIAPLGRVEPWLMAGIGFLDIDADRRSGRRDDFAFRSAAGLDVYLTPSWALYGEASYLLPTGEVKRYEHATFGGGILYRF